MLTDPELDRVCVVLVRARNPSNIGAVARAMHDFGFSRLRVVNEYPVPFEAAKSAVDASDVMAAAVNCASVAEAVADCTLVVGTTAVGERHLHHELLPLAEAAPRHASQNCAGPGDSPAAPRRPALRLRKNRPQQRRAEPLQLAAHHPHAQSTRTRAMSP